MTPSERDPPLESPSEPPAPPDTVAAFRAKDGSVVIYDEHQHTAWIRSAAAVDIDTIR